MLDRLFPKVIDNDYRGPLIAIWLLVPVVLLKLIMGFNVAGLNPLVANEYIIVNADGVPLDTFDAKTQELVMFLFASWGLALFLFCLFAIVALVRYRAMIPLAYLLLAAEQVGRKLIHMQETTPAPTPDGPSFGFMINLAFSIVLVVGFALSLTTRRSRRNS